MGMDGYKTITIRLRPETLEGLNRIAGKRQNESGKRVTVTSLVTGLILDLVRDEQGGA